MLTTCHTEGCTEPLNHNLRMSAVNLDRPEYVIDPPDTDWNDEPSREELFRSLPSPLYTTDADGWLTYYNEAAAEFWGHRPVLGQARWCGSLRLYEPDGAPMPHDRCPMALALRERRAIRGVQGILVRPDGTRVPFVPYPTPLFDRSGSLVGGSSIVLPTGNAPPIQLWDAAVTPQNRAFPSLAVQSNSSSPRRAA
jgi:PAS domain-containing protein